MTTVTRALNSIGKQCFVKYYYQFRDCTDKNYLAQTLLKDNSSASSLSAQMTRINYAKWIFENSLEKEALDIIIQSTRLDSQIIQSAKQIRYSDR